MLRLIAWMGAGVAALVWSLVSLVLFVIVSFVEGVFEGGAKLVSMPLGGVDFGIGWLSDLLGDIGQISIILLWLAGLAGIWFTKRYVTGRGERSRPALPPARIYDAPKLHTRPNPEQTVRVHAQPSTPTRVFTSVSPSRPSDQKPLAKGDFMKKVKGIAKGKNHGNQA